ncbi:hypothetical protein XU18_2728 [Perkinsela sp. CCAP 1560/4]|nr:hypothetical protein XU18_2728 [Perkinsela sp. CCAP 1560/4]|eukprot:KNH06223.1 hypothetical protein XU18_2728 [Perkinsela sp. CCAP 1560/4]
MHNVTLSLSDIPFSGVGPSLGRLDHASLSQHAVMEIAGMQNSEIVCGSRENPEDVTERLGVAQNVVLIN